ncbi:MAG: Glutamyl-tRNA(Gln) amidotransferase subunit A [candidate division TM6 bacterium GW2011_GWF2_28_16]|nr:MAG: Glutamyl-tRNA(Gln) amidotransferase subunit A [candidate division TM6 bacterium GW2011_GWF2_28_16]
MKPFLTIKDLKDKLNKKEVTQKEVITFYLNRLKKYKEKLNATIDIFDQDNNNNNNNNNLLAGVPGILKNNISIKNKKITCGSNILKNYIAPYDATVTEKLENNGAVILGTGNMDEFAMGTSGEFSAFGPVKNPWDLTRSPGGSSSGPAAAVAAGLVPWALGSETGGSVRQPASFSGLVGLYPTYGTFSRYGVVAFGSSNDQVGPLTKTVYDNALISTILMGQDPKDSTTLNRPTQDFTKNLTGKLPTNLKIGVIKDGIESENIIPEVKEHFKNAIKHLESLGAKIQYIDIPSLKYGISIYFIISRAEAASNLARFDGSLYGSRVNAQDLKDMYINTRDAGFGQEVKRRILMGNYVLSASHRDTFYNKADYIRSLLRQELENTFKSVDLLISPTTTTLPFKIGQESKDPLLMYMADYFTVPTNMTGNPALSLTCGYSKDNLPIGFQFIGPRLSEDLIYQVAYAFEQSTDYHTKNPAGYE